MRLRFVLSQLASGLRRNVSMTISVVLVTFISLVFVGAAALLQMQIGNMKDDWYDRVEVSVFMCPQDSAVPNCAGGEVSDEQLAEIDENLMRSELTQTQVGEHNKRRREIWAAMKEEEKTGGNDGSTCLSDGRSSGPQHEKGFAQETAESTGQTKQHVNKTISRVEKVCQEARDIIRGTKADTGAFLDQLAKMGDDDQVQTAQDKVDAIDRKERDEEFKEQEKRRKREAKEKQGAAFREFMNTMRPKFSAREWLELVRLLDDAQRKVGVSDMREYEDM